MGNPQFMVDPRTHTRLNSTNEVLDRFEDPSWLAWVELAGLMPTTKEHIRQQLEEHEQRQKADAEARQLVADCQCNEEGQKKWEAGKKATRNSLRPGGAMEHKGSKASRLGEEFSNLGLARTAENQAQQTKSEVAKHKVWEEIKRGQAPMGYILVSLVLSLLWPLLTISIGG